MIQILTDQYELIFVGAFPLTVIQSEALSTEVENVTLGAFLKPEDPLSPEHRGGELVIEEVLELANGEGAIALERHRGKTIHL